MHRREPDICLSGHRKYQEPVRTVQPTGLVMKVERRAPRVPRLVGKCQVMIRCAETTYLLFTALYLLSMWRDETTGLRLQGNLSLSYQGVMCQNLLDRPVTANHRPLSCTTTVTLRTHPPRKQWWPCIPCQAVYCGPNDVRTMQGGSDRTVHNTLSIRPKLSVDVTTSCPRLP
jgi:hypothetical protein